MKTAKKNETRQTVHICCKLFSSAKGELTQEILIYNTTKGQKLGKRKFKHMRQVTNL